MNPELKRIIDEAVATPNLSAEETDKLMDRAFKLAVTPEAKAESGKYLREAILRRKRPDVDVKGMLGDAAEFLNLSYIAKRYFGKDRAWLYQRLNGSKVNGKASAFTEAEIRTLSDSLEDIGRQVNQISFNLSHQS